MMNGGGVPLPCNALAQLHGEATPAHLLGHTQRPPGSHEHHQLVPPCARAVAAAAACAAAVGGPPVPVFSGALDGGASAALRLNQHNQAVVAAAAAAARTPAACVSATRPRAPSFTSGKGSPEDRGEDASEKGTRKGPWTPDEDLRVIACLSRACVCVCVCVEFCVCLCDEPVTHAHTRATS